MKYIFKKFQLSATKYKNNEDKQNYLLVLLIYRYSKYRQCTAEIVLTNCLDQLSNLFERTIITFLSETALLD